MLKFQANSAALRLLLGVVAQQVSGIGKVGAAAHMRDICW